MDTKAVSYRSSLVTSLLTCGVVFGLVGVVVSYLASLVAYRPTPGDVLSPGSTYQPDILTTIANIDNMFVISVVLLGAAALLQVHRAFKLYHGQRGFGRTRRGLDMVLLVLGIVLLFPAVWDDSSSKWTDWSFYLYVSAALALILSSLECRIRSEAS